MKLVMIDPHPLRAAKPPQDLKHVKFNRINPLIPPKVAVQRLKARKEQCNFKSRDVN